MLTEIKKIPHREVTLSRPVGGQKLIDIVQRLQLPHWDALCERAGFGDDAFYTIGQQRRSNADHRIIIVPRCELVLSLADARIRPNHEYQTLLVRHSLRRGGTSNLTSHETLEVLVGYAERLQQRFRGVEMA